MSDPLDGSLIAAAASVQKGELSARDLADAALRRLDEVQPRLNIAISVDAERALAAAAAADERQAKGEPLGPLHGIPLMHKDMYYRNGDVSTCGSRIRAEAVADVTATALARLDAAGALDLGRLNMSEFAVGLSGHNIDHGDCRNPWSPDHITGGSSSGSGAATAACVVFGALGSDTGGSIRLPAAVNGVVGLKPTQGRVSRAGAMPLAPSLDCLGPLARTTGDCARLFDIIAGHDPKDPSSSRRKVASTETAAREGAEKGLQGLKIGKPVSYFEDDLDPDIKVAMDRARKTLEDLGAEIVEVTMPDLVDIGALQNVLMGGEAASRHGPWLKSRFADFSPQVRARLLPGLAYSARDWQDAARLRPLMLRRFARQVFSKVDILATPTLPISVPTLDETRLGDGQGMPAMIARISHCTRPINYLGLPALSLPMGLTGNGLPCSLQLVGRPFAEAGLFSAGAAFEAAIGFTGLRPPHAAGTANGGDR